MTTRYTVELPDGQSFGPADAPLLRQWATQGRIPPIANIRADDGTATRAIDCEPIKDIMANIAAAPPMGPGSIPSTTDSGVSVLIPYKNAPALTGYYVSIASLLCVVGLIAGPAALYLGIKGLQTVKANPKAHGTAHAWIAIILGGLTSIANWGAVVIWAIGAAMR